MDIYAQNIMDHFRHPRHLGKLRGADVTHAEANYSCGDELSIDLKIVGGKIKDLRFNGAGCAVSQAAMSILSERVIGRKITDVSRITFADIKKYLGVEVSERRSKCALLGLMTLHNAILKQKKLPARTWESYLE